MMLPPTNSHQQGAESEWHILEVKPWETDISSAMIRIVLLCENSELNFSAAGLPSVVFAPFVSGFEFELINMKKTLRWEFIGSWFFKEALAGETHLGSTRRQAHWVWFQAKFHRGGSRLIPQRTLEFKVDLGVCSDLRQESWHFILLHPEAID